MYHYNDTGTIYPYVSLFFLFFLSPPGDRDGNFNCWKKGAFPSLLLEKPQITLPRKKRRMQVQGQSKLVN